MRVLAGANCEKIATIRPSPGAARPSYSVVRLKLKIG